MAHLRFFSSPRRTLALAATVAGMVLATSAVSFAKADTAKPGPTSSLVSLWSVPRAGGAAWLIEPGSERQLRAAFRGDTVVSGICQRSHDVVRFKVSESGRPCRQCGAGSSQAAYIAGKPLAAGTVEAMLRALPIGTSLRVTYNVPGKPDSGLATITVDRRSVLLAVKGIQDLTPAQLNALVKPLGVSHVATPSDGKQLCFQLTQDWTTERETQFEKRLARVGGALAYTVPVCCQVGSRPK